MITLLKKVIVTNHSIIAIFDTETSQEDEHITKVSLTKKQFYCSCKDFLFKNDLKMMQDGRVYKCKHIAFLEHLLINPNLMRKLVELGKMSYEDYQYLLSRVKQLMKTITNI